MKKVLSLILAAMMLLAVLAPAMAEDKVTLKIYAQYADDDTKVPYDYAVEKLKEAYPNVELELIIQAQDDGATLLTLAANHNLPDIFQTGAGIMPTLRASNQMMVLNDVAEKTGFAAKVFESAKDFLYSDDGNIYAFPYAGNEYVLWYINKAVFADAGLEIPTTYEDLLHCIEVFKSKDIVPMALFGQEGWITAAMFDTIATRYNAGGIKALDRGEAQISDEAYRSAAQALYDLTKAGLFQSSVTSTNYDQASEMFLTSKAAMFLNSQWYIEDATKALGDDVCWIASPAPSAEAFETSKNAFAGSGSVAGYAVSAESPNAELAAEVASFISEKYCEAKITLRNNPLVAVNTGLTNDTLPKMMQDLVAAIPEMTSTTAFTWGLTNTTFTNAIGTWTQALVSGEYTVDEFIEGIESEM